MLVVVGAREMRIEASSTLKTLSKMGVSKILSAALLLLFLSALVVCDDEVEESDSQGKLTPNLQTFHFC